MRLKRIICMAVSCMLLISLLAGPANAVEVDFTTPIMFADGNLVPFATGSFNMTIPAKSKGIANFSFPLAAGEIVTIKASYSPVPSNVDCGLIAPDGKFYYFNTTNGSIDKAIKVSESGNYTLQIRNNSDFEVRVSGSVNY